MAMFHNLIAFGPLVGQDILGANTQALLICQVNSCATIISSIFRFRAS